MLRNIKANIINVRVLPHFGSELKNCFDSFPAADNRAYSINNRRTHVRLMYKHDYVFIFQVLMINNLT